VKIIFSNNETMQVISQIHPNVFFLIILFVPLLIPLIWIIFLKLYLKYELQNFYEVLGFLVRYYLMISPLFFLVIVNLFPQFLGIQDLLKTPILIIIVFVIAIGAFYTDYTKIKSEMTKKFEINTLKSINQQLSDKYNIYIPVTNLNNICQSDLQYYYDYHTFFLTNNGSMSINLVKDKSLICVLQNFPPNIFKKSYQYNLKIDEKSINSPENVEYTLASVQLIDITDKQAFFIIKAPESNDSLTIIESVYQNEKKILKKVKISMKEDLNIPIKEEIEKIKDILDKMKTIRREM
jgi:hypothetical protein